MLTARLVKRAFYEISGYVVLNVLGARQGALKKGNQGNARLDCVGHLQLRQFRFVTCKTLPLGPGRGISSNIDYGPEQIGDLSTFLILRAMLAHGSESLEIAMKLLQVISRDGAHLYSAMIRKQAEIRRKGRGTFSRAKARKRNAARWTHVRYKGSINFEPDPSQAVAVAIRSPERGDESRLMSSFLGWLDRHFGERLSAINIEYR